MGTTIEVFIGEFIARNIDPSHECLVGTLKLLRAAKKLEPAPAIEDRNKISYYPCHQSADLPENHENPMVREEKAKMMKPGRFIQSIFPDTQLSDDVKRKFAEQYKDEFGTANDDVHMEIWSNVKAAYREVNYRNPPNSSELWGSCMNDKLDFIDFWEAIGVQVLVALNNENAILGRALVWPGVVERRSGNKFTFMDRIYTYSADFDVHFLKYAKEHGWIRRESYKTSGPDLIIDCDGDRVGGRDPVLTYKCGFDMNDLKYGNFPYSDTIRYINSDLDGLNTRAGIGELAVTDGESVLDENITIDVDGNLIDIDDEDCIMFDGEYYPSGHPDICNALIENNFSLAGYLERISHVADCVWSEIYDEYIHQASACHVEDEDDYVLCRDVAEDKDDNSCYEPNLVAADAYDGGLVSTQWAKDDSDFGWIYEEDVEEEQLVDIDQSGNMDVLESVDGFTVIDGQFVHKDEVLLYKGEFYNMENISDVKPAQEVADAVV